MRKLLYILIAIMFGAIASPAFALTVSPARVEISGDPGTTVRSEIELFNEQEGEKTFYTSFENFEPSGDSGAPRFIGAKDGPATWIKTDVASVSVESGKRIVVPFTIEIPKTAEPGGQFAAVFFGSQDPNTQEAGQVSVGGKIGVLVLLRVNGYVEEGGGLLDFSARSPDGVSVPGGKRVFTTLPINFVYRVSNTGGDRIVPKGEIKIKNTLRFTADTLLANKKEGNVLPNSNRKYEVIWGTEAKPTVGAETVPTKLSFMDSAKKEWQDFRLGWYTAELSLSWGETKQTASSRYHFFVFPWHVLILAGGVILVTLLLARVALKRYNKWIIAQAMRYAKEEEKEKVHERNHNKEQE